MTETWLAIDVGTTSAKAALVNAAGEVLESVSQAYPTHTAENGVVEQNPDEWWQAVVAAVRALDAGRVDAIALTGQMQDVILVDAGGGVVRPAILYSDTRALAEAQEINRIYSSQRLKQVTGNDQEASSLLAKLLWLTRHEVHSLENSAHLLMGGADYIALKLTGVALSDTTTASTTGLVNIETGRAHKRAFFDEAGLGVIERLLPSIRPGGQLVNELRTEAGAALGVCPCIPVYHGPGDAGATTLGAGSGEVGKPYGYIGTSGWVAFSAVERPASTGVFTLLHPHHQRFICIAPILTAGGNLDWARDLFGDDDTASIVREALEQPRSELLYLPYLNGERSPFSDPFARGAFIGLNPRHGRLDLCRAVLEGVAFAYRHALDALVKEDVSLLTLTGGGTRSTGWCQLIADICGVPVAVAEDGAHVGACGAVLAAQVASGQRKDYTLAENTGLMLRPDAGTADHYARQYNLFRNSYDALKPIFAGLGRAE